MYTFQHRSHSLLQLYGPILIALATIVFSNFALANSLQSIVDRTSISADESITLKVIYDSMQTNGEPDFSGLVQNFDIVSNNVSSQKSIINGSVTASTEWRMVLFPKKTGQLLIPPFVFQGVRSNPLTIAVSQSQPSTATGSKPDVFLETVVNKTNIYVQEQAIVTYRLFYNRSIRSLDNDPINVPNLKVQELPRADYQKNIGQQTYGVAEFRFAVIPDASGDITIPSQTWTTESTDQASNRFGFNGGRRKLHRVKTEAINIQVKPKPDNYPLDDPWLPASRVNIAESWSKPITSFKVGEPITRTVTVQAEGVAADLLPPIFTDVNSSDFKFYPDKPNQENQTTGDGLSGTRTESVAIVPNKSGKLTLPEISVTWWDSRSETIKYATLPAVEINVAAASVSAQPIQTTIPTNLQLESGETVVVENTSRVWLVIAGLSIVLNFAFAIALWRSKQSRIQAANAQQQTTTAIYNRQSQAFSCIVDACNNKDPQALRSAILMWAKLKWPHHAITNLQDLGERSNNKQLATELTQLNSALFSKHGAQIDFLTIPNLLRNMPEAAAFATKETNLQPLYGT